MFKSGMDKKVVGYIVCAFVFSVLLRMIWVYQFWDFNAFKWNGQFMINTNDGYYWAEGARDILRGFHQENIGSPVDSFISLLTAFFVKVLPFSFESVIFYISAFLSSLVVIPMILIAKNLGRAELGFIASLIAAIAWSYYNRTMVGYYDTDMLNIVFPVFLLWSLILAIRTNEDKYLIFTALEIVAYRFWYPQSYSLEFAFFGLILLYTLIYKREETYYYKLLAIMLFAMMGLPMSARLGTVLIVYLLYKSAKAERYVYYILGLSVILFFITGGFDPIWNKLRNYIFNDGYKVVGDEIKLHFFSVMQTVREAGKIPFETFANRISGHKLTFLLSIAGYLLMIRKYPVMLLGLPLLGLGFLAYVGGLRFTIYAVPVSAFGISYLILFLSDLFGGSSKGVRYLKTGFVAVSTLLVLYPNVTHIISYKVPTVFTKDEVKVLDKIGHLASRDDYVVSWWDYGYPIRYYSDMKTLIDGGKHSGDVNFPVSFILTNPQPEASKMARLDVEYTERSFGLKEDDPRKKLSYIAQMMKDYGFKDSNRFLSALKGDMKLPKKSRDVYLYLPLRMLNIFPTISKFSELDLMNAKKLRKGFFYQALRFKNTKNKIIFPASIYIDKAKGTIHIGNQIVPIKLFVKIGYDNRLKLRKNIQKLHPYGFNVIFMESYKRFLIVDPTIYNSTYIQLFVLENYDKKLFEPVVLDPRVKVYRLKI